MSEVYRRAENAVVRYGEKRHKTKWDCTRAVCKGVKRIAEKETVKDNEER